MMWTPLQARDALGSMLLELTDAVKQSAERVQKSGLVHPRGSPPPEEDEEAVHDLRVALRRLRTLLQPARWVYGKKRVRAVAKDLRQLAQETGALRDEEVLKETLSSLDVPGLAGEELMRWVEGRQKEEAAHRRKVITLLQGRAGWAKSSKPSLEAALSRLAKLVHRKQRRKARAISARALAERALADAVAGVGAYASAAPTDSAAMHALRIRYKRLRYTAELFTPLLGEGAAEIEKAATKMQRRLGDLHDLDEAIACIERARDLEAVVRVEIVAALQVARAASSERVTRELADASRVLARGRSGGPGASGDEAPDAVDVVSPETKGDA